MVKQERKKGDQKKKQKVEIVNATKKDIDYKKYKESRNLVVKELRKARNIFERKLAADVKNNPKNPRKTTRHCQQAATQAW